MAAICAVLEPLAPPMNSKAGSSGAIEGSRTRRTSGRCRSRGAPLVALGHAVHDGRGAPGVYRALLGDGGACNPVTNS